MSYANYEIKKIIRDGGTSVKHGFACHDPKKNPGGGLMFLCSYYGQKQYDCT
jgi:hypothetical protein